MTVSRPQPKASRGSAESRRWSACPSQLAQARDGGAQEARGAADEGQDGQPPLAVAPRQVAPRDGHAQERETDRRDERPVGPEEVEAE